MSDNVWDQLREILGSDYGGPALGVDEKKRFIIYRWYDAPVGSEILARNEDIDELLTEYRSKYSRS